MGDNMEYIERAADFTKDPVAQEVYEALSTHLPRNQAERDMQTMVKTDLRQLITINTLLHDAINTRAKESRDMSCRMIMLENALLCILSTANCPPPDVDCDTVSIDVESLRQRLDKVTAIARSINEKRDALAREMNTIGANMEVLKIENKRTNEDMEALKAQVAFLTRKLEAAQVEIQYLSVSHRRLTEWFHTFVEFTNKKFKEMSELIKKIDQPLKRLLRSPRLYISWVLMLCSSLSFLSMLNKSLASRVAYEILISLPNSSLAPVAYSARFITPLILQTPTIATNMVSAIGVSRWVAKLFVERITGDWWIRMTEANRSKSDQGMLLRTFSRETVSAAFPMILSACLTGLFALPIAILTGSDLTKTGTTVAGTALTTAVTGMIVSKLNGLQINVGGPPVVGFVVREVVDWAMRGSRYKITGERLDVTTRLAGTLEFLGVAPLWLFCFYTTFKTLRWALRKAGQPDSNRTITVAFVGAIVLLSTMTLLHLNYTNDLFIPKFEAALADDLKNSATAGALAEIGRQNVPGAVDAIQRGLQAATDSQLPGVALQEMAKTVFDPNYVVAPVMAPAIERGLQAAADSQLPGVALQEMAKTAFDPNSVVAPIMAPAIDAVNVATDTDGIPTMVKIIEVGIVDNLQGFYKDLFNIQ